MAFKNNYFDTALADEGILGTPLELLARATFGQESGSGRNTSDSYAGAKGPMQVMPDTFKSVADQGWNITDPYYNTRAGIRYLKQGWQASGGNPNLTAAYYYGGPGGMNKLANGIAVGDPRNPNAPNTKQYAEQVVGRMNIPNNGNNMAILNQVDPNQETQYTPNPILRQNPNAGILERIANAPGLSQGLMQAGAGLLASTGDSNPLAMGLSRGLTGFNKGYDQGIDNSKARAIPIAGGAFTQITDAQGNVTIVPNAQAQDFLLRQLGIKGQIAKDIANNKIENAPKTAAEQKLDDERVDAQNGFKDTKSSVDDLLQFGDKYKPGFGTQLAGTGAGKAVTDLLSGKSEDAATASQFQTKLSNVLTNKWLEIGSKLKGAQSDAEGRRLASTLPSPTADYDTVIKPWLQSYSKWLETAEKRAAEKLDPNNRYPEGSRFRQDNTGTTVAPPGAVDRGADLAPPAGTPQKEPKTIKLKNGTIVTVED